MIFVLVQVSLLLFNRHGIFQCWRLGAHGAWSGENHLPLCCSFIPYGADGNMAKNWPMEVNGRQEDTNGRTQLQRAVAQSHSSVPGIRQMRSLTIWWHCQGWKNGTTCPGRFAALEDGGGTGVIRDDIRLWKIKWRLSGRWKAAGSLRLGWPANYSPYILSNRNHIGQFWKEKTRWRKNKRLLYII